MLTSFLDIRLHCPCLVSDYKGKHLVTQPHPYYEQRNEEEGQQERHDSGLQQPEAAVATTTATVVVNLLLKFWYHERNLVFRFWTPPAGWRPVLAAGCR